MARTSAARSSAVRMKPSLGPSARGPRGPNRALGDADDLVGEVAGRHLHDDLLALLLAEQGPADRTLVADPALGRACLGRADDRERLFAVVAGDLHGRADLDVLGRVVLVDDRRVLDQGLKCLDPALDERLLVLGVLVFGV